MNLTLFPGGALAFFWAFLLAARLGPAEKPSSRAAANTAAARRALEAVWQYWSHTLGAVHVESPGLGDAEALRQALATIRRAGAGAGLSLRPRTPAEAIKPFLGALDLVLVMTVEPGFGGQAFMPQVLPKVEQVRSWFAGDLAVDGGITAQTGRRCREAGANVLVAGTSVFRSASYKDAIHSLRDTG